MRPGCRRHGGRRPDLPAVLRAGPGPLPPPVPGYRESLPPHMLAMLEHVRQASAIGAPAAAFRAVASPAGRAAVGAELDAARAALGEARREAAGLAERVYNN